MKLVSLFPEQNPSIHSIIILLNSTTGAIEAVRNDLLRSAVCSYKTGNSFIKLLKITPHG